MRNRYDTILDERRYLLFTFSQPKCARFLKALKFRKQNNFKKSSRLSWQEEVYFTRKANLMSTTGGGGNPPPTLAEIITPSGFVTPPPPTLSSSYSSSSSRVTQKWLQTGTLGLIAHGCKELSLRCHFQVSSGTHPDISAGCKTAVSHHSALSSVEVKNAWHIKWKRKFKLETGGTL